MRFCSVISSPGRQPFSCDWSQSLIAGARGQVEPAPGERRHVDDIAHGNSGQRAAGVKPGKAMMTEPRAPAWARG
jgi:hypothetical protein